MLTELLINVLASAVLVVAGYMGGKYRERKMHQGKNLEEYDFYPFGVDEKQNLSFDQDKFNTAVRHFLRHRDDVAARQLVLVGEQNDVANTLASEDKIRYRKLYSKCGGDRI